VVAEGDRVVLRWTARGTHRGAFLGVPPSGAAVRFTGIDIVRIADGRIQEGWAEESNLSTLGQLGVPLPG
jgi:predicted ester cyclase